MCLKLAGNELDAARGLMTFSLALVLTERFDVELDELDRAARLVEDLGLPLADCVDFGREISDMFDVAPVRIAAGTTIGDLVHWVVDPAFQEVAAHMVHRPGHTGSRERPMHLPQRRSRWE